MGQPASRSPSPDRGASGRGGRAAAAGPRVAGPTASELDQLVPADARVERLADGFDWSEGPVWVPAEGGHLLFSDVPQNVVYRWDETGGAREFLRPSGYTGEKARGGEPGSNGLLLDAQGRLVLMQHGDRRVARLEDGTMWNW